MCRIDRVHAKRAVTCVIEVAKNDKRRGVHRVAPGNFSLENDSRREHAATLANVVCGYILYRPR